MNSAEAERFLAQSIADLKLSGSEKQALSDWLTQNIKTDQVRGVVRHAAFETARKQVADPASIRVIEWLEDVLKVVAPVMSNTTTGPAAATAESVAFFAPGDACLNHIVQRIAACRHTADLCVFTITDDRISRVILDAHLRGVKIRIITDDDKSHDQGSDIQRFQEAGIAVKMDNDPATTALGQNGHMHHKFAILDRNRLINGSYNWTRGAAEMNYENIVDTGDVKLVAAFTAEFERLWKRF